MTFDPARLATLKKTAAESQEPCPECGFLQTAIDALTALDAEVI